MAERPEDLNLPITVVQRIIKESLPDGVIVSKEARQTICRASSVFVLYLTSCAVAHSNKSKRKTLAVSDIMAAIGDMEFESFIQPLNEILQYRKNNIGPNSKSKSAPEKKNNKAEGELEEEEIDDQEEVTGNDEGLEEIEEENLDEDSGRQNKKRKTGLETETNQNDETEEAKKFESSDSEESEPEEKID